ncbi:MAG TPA: DNA-processing protein DprA [Acidimicrobiales bacterium]|nr:DNA-processing protein DprA [Acidimicrobiales bacterium]
MSGPHREACAAALAALPGAGPATLLGILREVGDPAAAWAGVVAGRLGRPTRRGASGADPTWEAVARRADPQGDWGASRSAGIRVTWWGDDRYPAVLLADPAPPAVLFWRGDLGALGAPRVAIVGTRRCTPDGALTAWEIGRDLADAGVCVVSGLALGIDGAAHRGVLAAAGPGRPVAVAASGVDRPYPRRHAELWAAVAEAGAVLSETPPGRPAEAWRFPARNRVIAGLAEAVVVVESHAAGGSLLTVDAALERGVEVCAVPGPVRSPASAGTNQLLREGPAAVRDAQDVLDVLGDFRLQPPGGRSGPTDRRATGPLPRATSPPGPPRPVAPPPADPRLRRVLAAVGWRPTSLNQVVGAAGLDLGAVAAGLEELRAVGCVAEERGWWQRRS